MKILCVLLILFASTGSIYSQIDKNENALEVIIPEIELDSANKKHITIYEFEEGQFSIYFSTIKLLNIPKNITTSEELYTWVNEDIEDTVPDDFRYRIGHISSHVAYFTTTERSHSYEKETYLKLTDEGYVFKYSVFGPGEKDEVNSKYLKYYLDFLKNVKIK